MKNAAKAILINPQNKILLHLRDNKPSICYRGYWAGVGGEIKKRESPLEALEREIKEEIGCKADSFEFLGALYYSHIKTKVFIFKGKIYEPLENITLTEGQDLKYFSLEELSSLRMDRPFRNFILKNNEKIFGDKRSY